MPLAGRHGLAPDVREADHRQRLSVAQFVRIANDDVGDPEVPGDALLPSLSQQRIDPNHGEIQGRIRYRNEAERQRGAGMGVREDLVYTTEELASGENLVFAATGVTDGDLLRGVRFFGGGARTHSLVMAYRTKQVRFVDTVHMFDRDRPPAVRL